ncbi:hypothetical protein GCM10007968_21800 [Sporolactobacillus putidus]|uniref:Uncharacterized protein n=1 Tax=Sporolactobacillus putidus TaxID=492735 RepID=A0A917S6N3_9BACL|nr:hypothetical protein GCM10007968_21800 [Sporolactobacillus putidus]
MATTSTGAIPFMQITGLFKVNPRSVKLRADYLQTLIYSRNLDLQVNSIYSTIIFPYIPFAACPGYWQI